MSGSSSAPATACSTRPTRISWSPPGIRCSSAQSRWASAPAKQGLPLGPALCSIPAHASAAPDRANAEDRWRSRAPSTLTANPPCARIAASVRLPCAKQTSRSGGSSESEVTAFAVVPTGSPPGPIVVTTVTPVGNAPIAARSARGDTVAIAMA